MYVLRTQLTAAQVAEALRSSMDESELDFIFRVGAPGHQPIIGNADETQCRLMRRPGLFSSDHAGIFSANIFEEQDCTRLDGQFTGVQFGFPGGLRNRRVVSIASIKILIPVLIAFEMYNIIGSLLENDHPFLNPPAVFAGVYLIILCISYPIAIRTRKRQREFVLNHVKTTLNASLTP
jgi:hypothetical protein